MSRWFGYFLLWSLFQRHESGARPKKQQMCIFCCNRNRTQTNKACAKTDSTSKKRKEDKRLPVLSWSRQGRTQNTKQPNKRQKKSTAEHSRAQQSRAQMQRLTYFASWGHHHAQAKSSRWWSVGGTRLKPPVSNPDSSWRSHRLARPREETDPRPKTILLPTGT